MTFAVHGLPVARGIAIGRAVLVVSSRIDVAHYFIKPEEIETEIDRVRRARNAVADELTKLAGSFPCEVWLSRGDRRVNAKSIMGVMMLAAGIGVTVTIETNGDQEQQAMDALVALMNDKFGEGE